tara:strand:+ start:5786 stop:5983 length:198 start_codon:yes stop_codon:yes gene_type:complete
MTEQRPTLYSAIDPVTNTRYWRWLGKIGRVYLIAGFFHVKHPRAKVLAPFKTRSQATDVLWNLVK